VLTTSLLATWTAADRWDWQCVAHCGLAGSSVACLWVAANLERELSSVERTQWRILNVGCITACYPAGFCCRLSSNVFVSIEVHGRTQA
jgi:hypothetical protein